MRLALVLVLTWGLVPGLREAVESGVHYVRTGHAHALHDSGTDTDHGESPEHSCGVTLHHCGCCSTPPIASSRSIAVVPPSSSEITPSPGAELVRATAGPDRPFRPPIV